MSQDTAQIRKVQDKEGTQFFPITHVDAVIDENGDAVSTLLAGKQATLVSGTNIKTINSQSLLGSGNIVIEGGGGGGSIDSIVMNGDAVTVTGGVADLGTVITQHQDISGKADKVSSSTNGNFAGLDANGNLTDSGHKHSDYQAALVSGTNIKTVNSTSLLGSGNVSVGTYSKPSGGIPKTDLASAVQTSLGKADTALQSYTETDPTVPSWAKASSKPSYTFSEIGTTPTTLSGYGITDAKIASGTITLGTNSITPLTSYTETDPVFSASSAAGIQSTDITAWNAKLSGVTFNGAAATVTGGVAAITATIPAAPGTLQTNLTTAQTASASEALSGSIKLHKIAKTGTYSDLIGTPTIPTKVSELTNDAGYTTNTGTVTRVDVGTSQYSPTSGIVSLPAYPTTLPASDVSAWAKESSKPSYTLDEVSDGSTRKLADYLPLAGGTMTGDITIPAGKFIMSPGGYAMCGMDSTGNTFYCGPGDEVTNSFRLRSGNINLTHYKSGTPYTIWDASNSNLSTVDWATKELSIAGKTSHTSGHIYLEGAQATSSTGNTTQLIFGTSTTNHVSITSNTSAIVINPTSSTTTGQIVLGTNSKNTTFSSSGKFGIGTSSPSEKLSVSGNIVATGTITPGSDSRIKDNQKEISQEDAFSVIENLKPKTWTWNEKSNENLDGKVAAGLVAQEVKEILPDAVTISENGDIKDFHSLNYNTIQGYEIAAIKGLIEEVESLKAEIAELKKQIK